MDRLVVEVMAMKD